MSMMRMSKRHRHPTYEELATMVTLVIVLTCWTIVLVVMTGDRVTGEGDGVTENVTTPSTTPPVIYNAEEAP